MYGQVLYENFVHFPKNTVFDKSVGLYGWKKADTKPLRLDLAEA
jgi:hypothetical protein